jgi:hypothetical protein
MTTAPVRPKLGVTLYSFTPYFHGRQYTFWDLIRIAGERGLGPGLEVVGFQSIRGFPRLPDGFAKQFRQSVDDAGLELSALGANADAGIHPDRLLTDDELEQYMLAQLETARTLGFPTVRVQYSVTPDLMERLLPHAERLNLRLGMEIHAPHSVHHPDMLALLERYEKLGSPHLGFIPDWGSSLTRVPPSMIATYRELGLSDELLDRFEQQWNEFHRGPIVKNDDDQIAQLVRMGELGREFHGGDLAQNLLMQGVGLFGHQKPEDWKPFLPWAVHVHGKFYDIDADGNEPSIPHGVVLRDLVEANYGRYISTEWEGWHWNTKDDPFDMVAKQQALARRTLDSLVGT